MLTKIAENLSLDKDYPERSHKIDLYTRVLNGELYDKLSHAFCEEYDPGGKYIPLYKRKPSVRNSLCKVVVDQSISLLFGYDHFPTIVGVNDETSIQLNDLAKEISLREKMIHAALTGSVGSVVLFLRIIEQEIQIEVKSTQYLTPVFDPYNPKKLLKLTERFKVKGRELMDIGYSVDSEKTDYWFQRIWTDTEEIYYLPARNIDDLERDEERTVKHNLDLVPAIWIRNLPKASSKGFLEIDGACTFAGAVDISIEIDYLLSQGGRGLKYSSDPLVIFRLEDSMNLQQNATTVSGDASSGKKIIRSASNAFVLGQQDDAKLLEINGRASEAMIGHVRYLREIAMESIHGNRAHADKVGAHLSGEAQNKLNQALIWLADILRIYYGDNGIVPLFNMIVDISHKTEIMVGNKPISKINKGKITLNWPQWEPTSADEKKKIADTLKVLADSKHISQKTAVNFIAEDYNINDSDEEIARITEDQEIIEAQDPQIKEIINV